MVDISKFPRGLPDSPERDNITPNSTWLAPERVKAHPHWQFETGKILLSREGDQLIGVEDNRHLMTVAGSRAGKGVSAIVPNLLVYPGSVLVLDPKGDNAVITARRRKEMGQDVYILDPFGVCDGLPVASYNPLDIIDINSDFCVDDAALIADAIIIDAKGDNQYFTSAAKNWIRGLILHICSIEPTRSRNLVTLREMLTASESVRNGLIEEMQNNRAAFGVIRRAANAMEGKGEKERAAVLATAIEQTDFLDSPALQRVLIRSDFSLYDLKCERGISVFLSLPAGRMPTHARWFRIFVNLALEALERRAKPPKHPVLIIMDEFPILGYMEAVEKASGLVAGFGVRLWPIIQDLSQLQALYEKSWETFVGNAGLLQFFGNSDLTTLKYISDRLGESTVITEGGSKGEVSVAQAAAGFTGESGSINTNFVPLMNAEEVSRYFSRQSNRQLIFWPGSNPIALDRLIYFSDTVFDGQWDKRKDT